MRKLAKFALFVCAVLCCKRELSAEPGDFGRPRESIVADEFFPWLRDEFYWVIGRPVAAVAPFTDDERELRNLAYAILQPIELEDHSPLTIAGVDFIEVWNRWIAEPHPFDVQSYATFLIERPYRSHTARYAQLNDDVRADIGRVGPFFATANRVLEADAVRRRSFQFVRVPGENVAMANARMIENRGLIDTVYDRFRQRIASYRYALQCLLVLTPSQNAVEAERAIFVLEERLKRLTLPVAVAAGIVISK